MNRQSRVVLILIGIAFIALIMLAACNNASQPNAAPASSTSAGDQSNLAPDFQITVYQGEDVLGGKEVELSELLTQGKPVVLNFWAGLCPPCRLEMPDLQAVHEEYQDRMLMVGLDVGPFLGLGSREDGQALLQELTVTYPAGTTFDPDVVFAYQLVGMPTTYFITPQGEVVRKWTGLLTEEKLTELVEELLAASARS